MSVDTHTHLDRFHQSCGVPLVDELELKLLIHLVAGNHSPATNHPQYRLLTPELQ